MERRKSHIKTKKQVRQKMSKMIIIANKWHRYNMGWFRAKDYKKEISNRKKVNRIAKKYILSGKIDAKYGGRKIPNNLNNIVEFYLECHSNYVGAWAVEKLEKLGYIVAVDYEDDYTWSGCITMHMMEGQEAFASYEGVDMQWAEYVRSDNYNWWYKHQRKNN